MQRAKLKTIAAVLGCCLLLGGCSYKENQRLTTASIQYPDGTVKSYQTTESINPFYGLSVTFSGSPGQGTAVFDTSGCTEIVRDNFKFTCKSNGKLKGGSKATITAEYDKDLFESSGYKITCSQKKYIVSGVDFYPEKLEKYNKDKLNKAIRRAAKSYIDDNAKSIRLEFESKLDHNQWSESGSFSFTYSYHDISMMYNVNKNDASQNAYYIIYEFSNKLTCTEDMESTTKSPMKKGDKDTGRAYVVAEAQGIASKSDMTLTDAYVDFDAVKASIKTFTTLEGAKSYCTYGGEYKTYTEDFV